MAPTRPHLHNGVLTLPHVLAEAEKLKDKALDAILEVLGELAEEEQQRAEQDAQADLASRRIR